MKFISLFAGVGGFDLGMERGGGHECVAQVEWDKNAAGVLKRRWPDVPLFCDVSKVTGADLPDCDFITYGFPCQDLSVAGKREGLDGKRSGLFYEATRIIRELLDRRPVRDDGARGSGLRFALAENVAGLFSADDGLAFARCLRELLDCGSRQVGWRLLDSQYFGVAQRRRRVFIISDFGGESCDEVLAVSESLRGHPAPRREAGQGAAADAGGGFTAGSGGVAPGPGVDVYGGTETGEIACTVTTRTGCGDTSGPKAYQGGDLGGGSETLAVGCDVYNGEETGETAATVTSATGIANASGPKVMASFCATKGTVSKTVSTALCSNTGSPTGNGPKVCSWNGDETPKSSEEVCLTLRAGQGGEGVGVASNLTVRRLTPRECERLQGFPDDWTSEKAEVELVGNEWKATGKVVKQADGPRYKQMGNAVTVNVAAWFGGRLANVEEAEGELQV